MTELDLGRVGGAECALHPGRNALRTCQRCGGFMCGTCTEGGAQWACPSCREREGIGSAFPLDRSNLSFGGLLEVCWDAFQREWLMLSLGFLFVFVASVVGGLVSNLFSYVGGVLDSAGALVLFTITGSVFSLMIQGVATLGFLRMGMDVLNGQRADLGTMFGQTSKALPLVIAQLFATLCLIPVILLCGVAMWATLSLTGVSLGSGAEASAILSGRSSAAGLMALLVGAVTLFGPGLWFLVPLTFMSPALAYREDTGPLEVLMHCHDVIRGHRLITVGVLLMGVPLTVVGIVMCCVGLVPAMAFFNLLVAGLYMALVNGWEGED
ncbi:hypothetical protein LY474_13665 [Myxococcus stipitatus]|uniref:hypothetical protein n=1 Tax=Myxococcus stipitatus TaxID=83455 RepID=UPI001F441923|nr:hypothetical protein [Myxococcus stipitatus]MCE9668864.1 hypothetical protein [Myxococcus stipitatus]